MAQEIPNFQKWLLTAAVSFDKLALSMGRTNRISLGERIRELRDAKDLSLRELGKKLGDLSAAFLSDIELGRRHPSDKVLVEMARILGTTSDDLRSYDTRPAVEEIKRRVSQNPALGFALRKALDENVSSEELIRLLEQKAGRKKT